MFKFREGACINCGKPIGESVSSNKCTSCYKEKIRLKGSYRKEYWEGVRNGTIRRGVKYKHIVTSKPGDLLTFDIIYEDDIRFKDTKFIVNN